MRYWSLSLSLLMLLPSFAADPVFIRAIDPAAAATLGRGLEASPLVRTLVDELEASQVIVHIMSSRELPQNIAGTTRFEGMEELPQLVCDPRALRDGYLEALQEYLTEVRRGCIRQGVDYSLVRTGDYLDAVLAKFLHHRMALKSSAKNRGVASSQ